MAASKLFGATLLDHTNKEVPASTLDSTEVLGLYFSASWCPPCRGFTPVLCEWLKTFKAGPNGQRLDVVFVSSDRDPAAFKEYHGHMNFYALPFEQRDLKNELSKKFGVQGIPMLVLVNGATGEVITTNGRGAVQNNPTGEGFPWKPRTLSEILAATELVDNKGSRFSAAAKLQGKTVGIYFSAHWCPPCRGFTPELVKTYSKLVADGKPFEIIFASSDNDEDEFKSYFAEMPWLALPYDQRAAKEELSDMFNVEGIPTLVILDSELKVITDEGRAALGADPEGLNFPWTPKQVDELTGATVSQLNKNTIVIGFTDASEAEVARARGVMEAVAPAFADIKFFFTNNDDAIDLVRDFARLPEPCKLVIMDIPHQCKYLAPSNDLTQANIQALLEAYKAGTLQKSPIRS